VTELLLKTLASYLLGAVIGSLVVGRLRGGVDIRTLGSGNPGGTNALRTQGKAFAFWVVLIDVGKGILATRVIAPLSLQSIGLVEAGAAENIWHEWLPAACGFAAIIGHVYPVWHGFRGGKGVATLVGVLIGLNWILLLVFAVAWLLVAVRFGYVGLASMVAAAAVPIGALAGHTEPQTSLVTFGVVIAFLIAYTHRENIVRMRAGTEPRSQRLWLFGRGRTP